MTRWKDDRKTNLDGSAYVEVLNLDVFPSDFKTLHLMVPRCVSLLTVDITSDPFHSQKATFMASILPVPLLLKMAMMPNPT